MSNPEDRIQQVGAWKTSDGSLHETESEAMAYESKVQIEHDIREFFSQFGESSMYHDEPVLPLNEFLEHRNMILKILSGRGAEL